MIYGIGTDIVQISRIEAALQRNGEAFAERILGPDELAEYRARVARAERRGIRFVATRFAAKEAFAKAIGLGMREPMNWHAMQVLGNDAGKPSVATGGALTEFMQQNGLHAQVSITDEAEYAVAFVIVEKR
jgi:holo-[acyl-carrier protein] synthase